MQLRYIPIDKLTPLPDLRYRRTPHIIPAWTAALHRVGVLPVVANQQTRRLLSPPGMIAGLFEIRKRGNHHPPGVRLDTSGRWCVPVVVGDWQPAHDSFIAALLVGGVDGRMMPPLTDETWVHLLLDLTISDTDAVSALGLALDELGDLLDTLAGDTPPTLPTEPDSANEWGIPALLPDLQADSVPAHVVKWGTVARSTRLPGALYHFYTEDRKFRALVEKPELLIASGCAAVIEPNFSMKEHMPPALVLHRVYQKRSLARRWQESGVRVFVDLNVPRRYFALNLLGVPVGWRAYANRAYTRDTAHLDAAYQVALQHAGGDALYMVYGGGKQVQQLCLERGWQWIPEDSDRVRKRGA